MGRKIQVVQCDDVIGADHKVEIITETERMEQDFLWLCVLERQLVALLILHKQQCQFSIGHLRR